GKAGAVSKTGRVLLVALAALLAVTVVTVTGPARAGEVGRCLPHPPGSTGDYQAITDSRDGTFGVGDMTSAVQLPDGRLFYTFGDTAYYGLNADGSAGANIGFGNNSAWVQSGNCFTLLYRSG